jgi:hypothetical protein
MRPQLKDEWDDRITKVIYEACYSVLNGADPKEPTLLKVISDCWLQSPERRPDMEEVQQRLSKIYDKLKKTYEKDRKSKKESTGDGAVPAHTGQLEELVQMAAEHATPVPTGQKAQFHVAGDVAGDGKATPAADADDTDESGSYESGSYESSYETEEGDEDDEDEDEDEEETEEEETEEEETETGSYSYETESTE